MTHLCHGGCGRSVPPKLWGCRACWFALPANIRLSILRTYRPGQEEDKQPSAEYVEAAKRAREYVAAGKRS